MKYLVLSRCEDDVHTSLLSKEQLEERLGDDWKGYDFLAKPPNIENMPSKSLFIFGGDVVIPQAEQVVTKFKV
jgi:hypothetical protein